MTTAREALHRLGRYVFTGGAAAVTDLGAFALLHPAVLSIPAAATCAFTLAALLNYTLTSLFVFRHPLSLKRLGLFVLVSLAGLTVNVGVTVVGAMALDLPAVAAKTAGIGSAFLVNFWLNSVIVFRAARARSPD
jgi:putative flippase GtrA